MRVTMVRVEQLRRQYEETRELHRTLPHTARLLPRQLEVDTPIRQAHPSLTHAYERENDNFLPQHAALSQYLYASNRSSKEVACMVAVCQTRNLGWAACVADDTPSPRLLVVCAIDTLLWRSRVFYKASGGAKERAAWRHRCLSKRRQADQNSYTPYLLPLIRSLILVLAAFLHWALLQEASGGG